MDLKNNNTKRAAGNSDLKERNQINK